MFKGNFLEKTVYDIFNDYNSEILGKKELYLISHGGIEVYEITINKSKNKYKNMVFHETIQKRTDNSLACLMDIDSDNDNPIHNK